METCFSASREAGIQIHFCGYDPFPFSGSGLIAPGADIGQTLYFIWPVILSALVASSRCFWGDAKAGYPQRLFLSNPRHQVLVFSSEAEGTVTWVFQYLDFPQLSEALRALNSWLICPKNARHQFGSWLAMRH